MSGTDRTLRSKRSSSKLNKAAILKESDVADVANFMHDTSTTGEEYMEQEEDMPKLVPQSARTLKRDSSASSSKSIPVKVKTSSEEEEIKDHCRHMNIFGNTSKLVSISLITKVNTGHYRVSEAKEAEVGACGPVLRLRATVLRVVIVRLLKREEVEATPT